MGRDRGLREQVGILHAGIGGEGSLDLAGVRVSLTAPVASPAGPGAMVGVAVVAGVSTVLGEGVGVVAVVLVVAEAPELL